MTRFGAMIGKMTDDDMKELLSELVPQMSFTDVVEILNDVLSDNEKAELAAAMEA